MEIGGNFDRERLLSEVIEPLKNGETVKYRPYVCYKGGFDDVTYVTPERINIVEGSYSMHPALGNYADIKIFVSVPPDEQILRLKKRDPAFIDRFINEWIPKEMAYFEAFDVKKHSDIIVE